jgi:predicted dinucleotide-binding enzyme
MKIGILGSGDVAKTLAGGFLKHGHDVMLGTRTPAKLNEWLDENPQGRIASFTDAAKFAELVVLAVKGTAAADVLRLAGAENFAGKPVIDVTNPIADSSHINGVLEFYTNLYESQMELLQCEFTNAHFVKSFNSVGNAFMVNPKFNGCKPTMFICGNNEEAKKIVSEILDQFGWEAEDMGKVEAARSIEPLCLLWHIPGALKNQLQHLGEVMVINI